MSVRTLRGGWAPVRAAIAICHVLSPGDPSPVILRRGSLGAAPTLDLALPADQRVIVNSRRALPVTGQREVAVSCRDLAHLDEVVTLAPVQGTFVHLVLDSVDAVLAGDLWLETTDPRPDVLEALGAAGRRQLFSALPRLALASGRARYVPAWPVLSSVEAQEVI